MNQNIARVDGLLEIVERVSSAIVITGIYATVEQKRIVCYNEYKFEDENYRKIISLHWNSRNNLGVRSDI